MLYNGRMNIKVNGGDMEMPEGSNVAELLGVIGFSDRRVAVELNRVILAAAEFAAAELHEGDVVEVLGFVGGG